jgi:RNA polymerase subunit RPABC4/transcription elongation factor Spt4
MENRNCIKCKQEINPLRVKALPNTKTCVDCSTVGAKKGMSMVFGEKDHTWNDMVIIDANEATRMENIKQPNFTSFDKVEMNNDDDDDMKLWDNTLLDGLEDL